MALTKLICTIGPASSSRKAIKALARAGMSAARINTAFGDEEEWREIVENVRAACGAPVIFDLKGPDTRIIAGKERNVAKGETVAVGFSEKSGANFHFNREIAGQVAKGNVLVVNGGLVKFRVISKDAGRVYLKALNGGFMKNGGSVHSLTREFSLPAISRQDRKAIKLAKKLGEEVFALSMARSGRDVESLRALAGKCVVI